MDRISIFLRCIASLDVYALYVNHVYLMPLKL